MEKICMTIPVRCSISRIKIPFFLLAISILVTGCGEKTVTLYRNSVLDKNARYRMATFDAKDLGPVGNRENCNMAASAFQSQPGVKTKFWCEE